MKKPSRSSKPSNLSNRDLSAVRGGAVPIIIIEKKVTSPRDTSTGQSAG